MIRWTEAPKADLDAPKLVRVRPKCPMYVKLLNRKYVGLDTHYWGGHTVHCPGSESCKACQAGLFPVWSGFIFVQLWDGGRVAVLALTPVMAANITMLRREENGLLGMKMSFRRKTKAPNSGVITEFHGMANEFDEQSIERLTARVRIIFKDYCIQDLGPPDGPNRQQAN